MHKNIYYLLILQLMTFSTYGQCTELVRLASKQSDRVVVRTNRVGQPSTEPIQYRRVQEKGQTKYFVQLYATGGSMLPQKGATVLFTDGSSIQWPHVVIKSLFNEAGHTSRCLIKLTEDEIEQFQDKTVASIMLFTQHRLVNIQQAQRAKNIINCVIGADLIELKSDRLVSHQ